MRDAGWALLKRGQAGPHPCPDLEVQSLDPHHSQDAPGWALCCCLPEVASIESAGRGWDCRRALWSGKLRTSNFSSTQVTSLPGQGLFKYSFITFIPPASKNDSWHIPKSYSIRLVGRHLCSLLEGRNFNILSAYIDFGFCFGCTTWHTGS